MDSAACSTLVIDAAGQIVAFDGAEGQFGIHSDIAGRAWDQVFAGWGLPSVPLGKEASRRIQTRVAAPTGEELAVEIVPIPDRTGARQTLATFRPAFGESLTDRQQQLCGVGEVSAGVAHEVNNALTLVLGWLELLKADHEDNPVLYPTLELLLEEANRIADLMRNLRDVARGDPDTTSELDVQKLMTDVIALVRIEMRNSNIELQEDVSDALPLVQGNPGRLKQALLNLLLNAREAMPKGGRVVVSAQPDAEGNVSLAVSDNGCGVPDDVRSSIFSPFFTTKKNGSGLGLSVTRKIVEEHGGALELDTAPGEGARFTLRFPAVKV